MELDVKIRLGDLRDYIQFQLFETKYSGIFNVGDPILWGKYKNKSGKIKKIYKDEKDHATIDVEPVPKGRKNDVTMGLYRVWPGKEKEEDLDEARKPKLSELESMIMGNASEALDQRNDPRWDSLADCLDSYYENVQDTAVETGMKATYPGEYFEIYRQYVRKEAESLGVELPEDYARHSSRGERDENLDEVDLDPTNNPGRPDDAFEYLGMHPSPTAAMSHPFANGGGGDGGAGSTDGEESSTESTEET